MRIIRQTSLALSLGLLASASACSDGTEPGLDGSGGSEQASGGADTASGGANAASGGSGTSTGGGDVSGGQGGEGSTECVDEPVPGDSYTCAEQAGWGKCDEEWMRGYCNLSCARCGDLVGADCGMPGVPPDLDAALGEAPASDCSAPAADECPFADGLSHACVERFALGINYAWRDFGTDFGGLSAWSLGGISGNVATYNQDLANMKANGAGVIRWWMFPDFRGDGILMDEADSPIGISEGTVADIQLALELAQRNDVYLVLTLFSFDAFRPSRMEGDVAVPGISALVQSEAGRAALIENVVTPIAAAVADSPYASRLLGWDVINEPEWAILAEPGAPADGQFSPNSELTAVSLADMKAFINATLAALGTTTPGALRSVGWAAAKWAWAFEDVTAVEFNQPHIYSWVNDYWPYTLTPAEVVGMGYPDVPVVMGEFYLLDGPFGATPSFETVMNSWYEAGYAGAWPWQYFDGCIAKPGAEGLNLNLIADFSQAKGCSVSY